VLDLAIKYETKLQELFNSVTFDEKYMFFNGCSYRDKYKAAESTWNKHEFVSLDKKENVIGYIKYNIDRDSSVANSLQIINFTDNKIVFGRDVMQALDEVFTKFKFRKMRYSVYVGNPIESTYDKLTLKYGGRIVGVQFKDDKLLDGNYYDFKSYEIFRDDYLLHKNKHI
jgi:hypothetical protein